MKLINENKEIEFGNATYKIGDKIRYRKRKMLERDGWVLQGKYVTEVGYIYAFSMYAGNDIAWVTKDRNLKDTSKINGCVHLIDVIEKI